MQNKSLQVAFPFLKFSLFGSLFAVSFLAQSQTLRPVAPNPTEVYEISKPKAIALGLYVQSLYPMGSAFQNTSTGDKNFRFQTPFQVGAEFGYALTPLLEMAAVVGYDYFATRVQTASGNIQEYKKVKTTAYIVGAMARYKLSNRNIAPEFEAGASYGFGKINIGSTNVSAVPVEKDLNSYRVYGSGGVALAWTDEISLHAGLGYGYIGWGSKTYTGTYTGVKQSPMQGVFAKSSMSFNFLSSMSFNF